ncbi:dihydroorotase [Terrimicrobium sacchariphilum]|uniref:Dihydroorotase n=1 Tax=Terrimicrobium sacchariphilum TaxID=690879 RepID=A0A146GA40_TERSA|nr:dihydroorotase [Terrimicrobium sacchariphilum]GAT34112.1 dihydroorotase [Terrimicrobium sacchariphilum]
MSTLRIFNGRIIDPANGRDEKADLWIRDGVIIETPVDGTKADEEIDAKGRIVAPGLIDIHVHFREPGQSHKETIGTGSQAAAAGGFTSVVCMPNTSPAADNAGTITLIREKAATSSVVNIFTTGAITKGLAGQELAPYNAMVGAGIVAITDDGHCVQNHEVMRRAVEYARMFGLVVLDHCQDYSLVGGGVMNEGEWSLRLGLPGWPRIGEEIIVMRNILLADLCDSPIHCQHISSGGSVRLIREARARGVKISGEVCPHHIALTDDHLQTFDSNYKMNPPLRTERDIEAIIGGIADGTLDILCSDHAPHAKYEKEVELDQAPFGILGLETEFGLFSDILVHKKKAIDMARLIELYTSKPAKLLSLDRGTLGVGAQGDVTLIDPDLEWVYDKELSPSLSRNTPFHGTEMKGRAVQTIVAGKTVWSL